VLEICISPTNGWLNSRIRKSAAEAEIANINSAAVVRSAVEFVELSAAS